MRLRRWRRENSTGKGEVDAEGGSIGDEGVCGGLRRSLWGGVER